MALEFSKEARAELKSMVKRYPDKRSALMNALHLTQREFGSLTAEALEILSKEINLPVQHIEDTSSFYTMFFDNPVGRHVIWVCHTLPCALRGSAAILEHIKEKLGIEVGETTADGRFTLFKTECLASCGTSPVIQVNDRYYEDLTPGMVDRILDEFD